MSTNYSTIRKYNQRLETEVEKNIFDVFVSPWAILNFNKYRVTSPFSDMTLHFFDTTTTGL